MGQTEEIRQLIENIIEDLQDVKIRLGGFGEFNPQAMTEVYSIIQSVIQAIEEFSQGAADFSGEEKRDAAVEILNDLLDIPFMPEFVEASLIGWSIDILVTSFNRIGGQEWLDVLFNSESE
jgi:hypothetical protein